MRKMEKNVGQEELFQSYMRLWKLLLVVTVVINVFSFMNLSEVLCIMRMLYLAQVGSIW